ncbi:MAG TPA: hypothetical protein VE934_11555 [Polaromonas sp.]|uniref:hypothetical protein n=1 Tax=Polaromonas sp. TaxID=1869339 RepID=UPI002D29CC63|nr:hypothetical protein [Polaromonas sp.]HYW57590.1 hypothetical protein [Polaromonas sp.]
MKLLTPQNRPAKPGRARSLVAAGLAYVSVVGASVAAAAALVVETAPWIAAGI